MGTEPKANQEGESKRPGRKSYAALITPWAEEVCTELGLTLWNCEYLREAGQNYLRVTIDKEEGVGIEDCEQVSRLLNDILDREDPIAESYSFQVSSPGVERELKKPAHFVAYIGSPVRVRLYKAQDNLGPASGVKEIIAPLAGRTDTELLLTCDTDSLIHIPLENVAKVKLYYEFDFGGKNENDQQ